MLTSKEEIFQLAKSLDYKPEIIEKVDRLLSALKQIMAVPYLRDRLVLKGGTALNLFSFRNLPRLSVDIDLNYVGALDKTKMFEERGIIDDALKKIFYTNDYELYRNPGHHAGGKMVWRYPSALGQHGNLEIDVNYMYRQPLWPSVTMKPIVAFAEDLTVPVLDVHELAAGKLSALFTRQASRDLFDASYLFSERILDVEKLRLAFIAYLGMTKIDIYALKASSLAYDITDIKNKLLPVLRQQGYPRKKQELIIWADNLLLSLKSGLEQILPLTAKELEFIENIREDGLIRPELITGNRELQEVILLHPALQWAALRKDRK